DGYAFVHDRVRDAAYALIPEPDRARTHLRLGQILWADASPEELERRLFDIVGQLAQGPSLIAAPEERARAAALQLAAGRRARRATAYASALRSLAAADELLGEDRWSARYALAFAVELHTAECEFLTAAPAAEQRLGRLAARAVGLIDRAAVASLRVTLLTTL